MTAVQSSLLGDVATVEHIHHVSKSSQPWSKDCCEACWNAREKRCVCRCGGVYHGAGLNQSQRVLASDDIVLSSEQSREFISSIQRWTCNHCGGDLSGESIRAYPHESGWHVAGFDEKQWLYIVCPICRYQWALWKLGVRYFEEATIQ